jgi:glycosyltransferase involved in cell wall biosynthesis
MKILMCNSFHYLRGGAERCFINLMELLKTKGHKVIPFSMHSKLNRHSPYSKYFVSYINFPEKMRHSSLAIKWRVAKRVIYATESKQKIDQLIKDERPQIAHLHGIAHELSPSILDALKNAGIPIVQTLHDFKLRCPNTNFISNGTVCERCKGYRYYNVARYRCKRNSLSASILAAFEAYIHFLLNIYEKNVDVFISPSIFLKKKMLAHGVTRPILQIPNFIHIENFNFVQKKEPFCLFFGRLEKIKGVMTLIKAMRYVGGYELRIAGSGEAEGQMRKLIQRHKIPAIRFLGHLDTKRLAELIGRASFSVMPSECYENYPMSVIESFACGTPVIGANIGGIAEIVREHHNGLLFEPGDHVQLGQKINNLIQNKAITKMMGQRARHQVEIFNNQEHHYQRTIALYKRLL